MRVDASGWQVLGEDASVPVRFVKRGGMLPLPTPERGGRLEELREVLSLADEGFTFAVAWLIGCFLDEGGMPILVASGEQGSGKSTGCEILRHLIDPHRVPLKKLPKDDRDLAAAVRSNFVQAYDNVSHLSADRSDTLCMISTGTGFSARKLYSDAEESTVEARSPIILNGIGDFVTRADLLDRTLTIRFLRLEDTGSRKTRKAVWQAVDRMRPRALGALLDRLVAGFARLAETEEEIGGKLPRLADLAILVTAGEPVERRGEFLALLAASRSDQSEDSVVGDVVASEIVDLVSEKGELNATAEEIRVLLNGRRDLYERPKNWPVSAHALGKYLDRIGPYLRHVGIGVERLRTARRREWRLWNVSPIEEDATKAFSDRPS